MNRDKQKSFNQKMSLKDKYPRHINMKKGGMVIKHYDDGGTVHALNDPNTALSGPANYTTNGNVATTSHTLGGNIAGELGLSSGFQAGGANLQAGTNNNQLNNAYQGVQGGLNQVQDLANTLVPSANLGVQNQDLVQQSLVNQLNGVGPNPAQAALNQNTMNNVNQQAALMAGQRGAGANAGLIAREAAQQGAQTQQQAVGQQANLQAQQQIAAQQGLGNLASQQIGQAGTGVQAVNTAQQNEQGLLQGANTGMNSTLAGQQASINSTNAATASKNASGIGGLVGGLAGAVGSIFSGFAHGGDVHKMAAGGEANWGGQYNQTPGGGVGGNFASFQDSGGDGNALSEGLNAAGEGIADYRNKPSASEEMNLGAGPAMETGAAQPSAYFEGVLAAHGGMMPYEHHLNHVHNYFSGGPTGNSVDAMVTPGEHYLTPHDVHKVIHEGADPLKLGHKFPGKPKKPGHDDYANDVLPAKLQEGGVVLDLETLKKKSPDAARKFVHKAVAKHMKKPMRKNS